MKKKLVAILSTVLILGNSFAVYAANSELNFESATERPLISTEASSIKPRMGTMNRLFTMNYNGLSAGNYVSTVGTSKLIDPTSIDTGVCLVTVTPNNNSASGLARAGFCHFVGDSIKVDDYFQCYSDVGGSGNLYVNDLSTLCYGFVSNQNAYGGISGTVAFDEYIDF